MGVLSYGIYESGGLWTAFLKTVDTTESPRTYTRQECPTREDVIQKEKSIWSARQQLCTDALRALEALK